MGASKRKQYPNAQEQKIINEIDRIEISPENEEYFIKLWQEYGPRGIGLNVGFIVVMMSLVLYAMNIYRKNLIFYESNRLY